MTDYSYVPKVQSEADVFTQGLVICTKEGIGDYKIAYVSDNTYDVRVGLYQSGITLYFVFVTNSSVSDLNIYLVSPVSTTLFDVSRVILKYESGYYAEEQYTIVPDNTSCTVFNTRNEVLSAMVVPEPSPTSGVVVTVNASPTYTPPTTEGVIVNVIARLADPNQQGGTSTTGGGTGTFDDSSDNISIPELPSISAANSGLVTLFRPTLSDIHDLGSYLWTNITDFIENLQKLFSNPMDYFVAFHIVPCVPEVGIPRNIKIGLWNTNISMSPVISQWHEHNCGTVFLPEYWGSALDYAPNTKVSLFLPFIGSVALNTDEVMNQQINVTYRIDLLSGLCVAMVSATNPVDRAGSVVYQYTGECSVSVPLTGADWSRIYAAGIGAVGTAITGGIGAAASGAAAGGATAALTGVQAADAVGNVGMAYSLINDTSKGVKGVVAMRDSMQQAANMAIEAGKSAASAPARVAKGVKLSRVANTVNNTIGSVMTGKQMIPHSGSISGSAGMLGVKRPYLIVEYPNQSLAENYKHFVGYPSNMYATLGTLSGYTECEQVIPSASYLSMNDTEIAELLDNLKNGVYLNFDKITNKGTGITLYQYGGSPNTIGKNATLVDTLTGTFRDSVSISNPVFTIERQSPIGFNYVYIEAFDRFYYVNGVSADLKNIVTVSCTIDVLETAGNSVKDFQAIIRRQENKYNLYLDDGIFKAYQNTKHKIIAFPNPFTDYSYILAIAGNSE